MTTDMTDRKSGKLGLLVLLAFVTMFTLDYLWVGYTRALVAKRSLGAANYALLLFLVGAVNTLAYVAEPTLILPGAAGAWAGTFVASGGMS